MGYKLFLDDIRVPVDVLNYNTNPIYNDADWVIVRSYDTFCAHIRDNGVPNVISFDHDLALYDFDADEITGYDCANWFINYCLDNDIIIDARIYIHSMNPTGVLNIKSLFDTYNKIYKS